MRARSASGPLAVTLCILAHTLAAQVTIAPSATVPAAWERFAVRVVNQIDTATVAVRVSVPDGVQVLGVAAPPGWTFGVLPATDSAAQRITWSGGRVDRGALVEFAFLGRVVGDAKPGSDLVFPVRLTREGGAVRDWAWGGDGRPPTVAIHGTTILTAAGAYALAGAAVGLSVLAVGLSFSRRRTGAGA